MADGVAGNDNFTLDIYLTESTGGARDLSNQTAYLRYKISGANTDFVQEVLLTQIDTTGGHTRYVFESSDLLAGDYEYECDLIGIGTTDLLTTIDTNTFSIRAPLTS
jgi:hypothetical protein